MISEKIAKKIANNLELDNEKFEVINYGLFAFLQIMMSLALVTALGWFFGLLSQSLIVSFTSSILRQYSGGIHASKPSICLIIGTIVTISIAYIARLINTNLNVIVVMSIGLIITIISYFIIYKKAPVDSKTKPINNTNKRIRMKRKSLIVLSIYLIIAIILLISYNITKNQNYKEYVVCIYLAFGWQVFTLTIIGHRVLEKIDLILSTILFKEGGKHNEKI